MRWDIFDEFDRMHRELDRMFSRNFGFNTPLLGYEGEAGLKEYEGKNMMDMTRKPICHMQETEKNMEIMIELPGVKKENIDLTVDDDKIEVNVVSKKEKKEEKKGQYTYMSASHSFHRMITLPKNVDSEKAKAEYKNGMLRIKAPKREKEDKKRKKLDIQ